MTRSVRPTPLWVIGAVAGAFTAVVILGPKTLGTALILGGGAVAWTFWRWRRQMKSERSVLAGLQAHWASLPGATWHGDVVSVHHGDQPITVHITRADGQMRARIATPMGDQPMAFRIWPTRGDAPSLTPEDRRGSGPALTRSALVESWLAGRFHAESNDEERLAATVDKPVLAALFSLSDTLGEGFEGVAYDGQRVTVGLRGPIVADPERAAQLARVVWQAFVP